MRTKTRQLKGDAVAVRRTKAAALLGVEHLTELEIVFELYCELWELTEGMPPHDALLFVLDELAESGVSADLRAALAELRALPFVASAPGTMSDRDRIWFGLQIMLNQLLHGGKPVLSSGRSRAGDVARPSQRTEKRQQRGLVGSR